MTEPRFDLCDVAYSVPERDILQPLSLALEPGRIHGLIGPNGSGKSTLVRLLARQLSPSGGRVDFAGQPLPYWRDRAFARRVAYMPQFTPAADGMSVRELVALGRFPWHGTLGRFTPADADHVERALDRTDLQGMAERMVDTLSGGERQRAWLALMLAQAADCILLDEPTSALDVSIQAEVLNLLQALRHERKLTYILVSHDLAVVAHMCERLLVMQFGRGVEEMSAATLAARAPQTAYAQQLLTASEGFKRQVA